MSMPTAAPTRIWTLARTSLSHGFIHCFCHGFHVSFGERIHDRLEHVGKKQQALDVGIGTTGFPVGDDLTRNVNPLGQIVLEKPLFLAIFFDASARLYAMLLLRACGNPC